MNARIIKRSLLVASLLGGSVWGVALLSGGAQTLKQKPVAISKTTGKTSLTKYDRLQIWHDVLIACESSKEINAVVVHDTGRDRYDSLYMEALKPTLDRYGLDRKEAFLVFEEEGGWPFPLIPHLGE